MTVPRRVRDVPEFQRLLERGEFSTRLDDDGEAHYWPTRRVKGEVVPGLRVGRKTKIFESCTREDLLDAIACERRSAAWSRWEARAHDRNAELLEAVERDFERPAPPRLTVIPSGDEAAT